MRIDIITIFPNIFNSYLNESIIKRAQKSKALQIYIHNLRNYTKNIYNKVDDSPFGGGSGMVMMVQPIYDAINTIRKKNKGPVIYLSPKGTMLTHTKAKKMSKLKEMILLCGRYEGVDQRAIDLCVDQELSIGKYILTGGELAAMVVFDTICRFIPGVLGDSHSAEEETFSRALKGKKEYPHFTKPRIYKGKTVPDVLLNGNHAKINTWRKQNLK